MDTPVPWPNLFEASLSTSSVKKYDPSVVAAGLFMEQLDATVVDTAIPSIAARLPFSSFCLLLVRTERMFGQ